MVAFVGSWCDALMRVLVIATLLVGACRSEGLPGESFDGGPADLHPASQPDFVSSPTPVFDLSVPPPPPTFDLAPPPRPDMTAVGPWSCLGNQTLPTPASPLYKVVVVVTDFLSHSPIVGATVRVCALQDVACTMPLFTASTDGSGTTVVVAPSSPTGIAAYLDVTAMNVLETLAFPVVHDPDHSIGSGAPLAIVTFKSSTLSLVAAILGVTLDPARGEIYFTVDDCSYTRPAAGMLVTEGPSDAESHVYYMSGNLPTKTATQTDASGAGFILNSLTGLEDVKVGGFPVPGATTGVYSFLVRPGALTITNFSPNQ